MDRKKVTVYVRKGASESERTLSFDRLPEISAVDVLKAQIAIDGNSFLCSVGLMEPENPGDPPMFAGPDFSLEVRSGWHYSLADALAATESVLIKWLDGYGYDVEFD